MGRNKNYLVGLDLHSHLHQHPTKGCLNILDRYLKLQNELKAFSENLFDKPQILVATKMDDPQSAVNLEKIKPVMKEINSSLLTVSSVTGEGVEELLWKIKEGLIAERERELEA